MNPKVKPDSPAAVFAALSLQEKIGQMLMAGFPGPRLPDDFRRSLQLGEAGAVMLLHDNVETIDQVVALTNEIHGCRAPAPMIWTDQEGGNVVQFGEIAATTLSAMGLAATGKPSYARSAGRIMGRELSALGVDGVFAPVLDVNTRPDNPIIGFRAFSDDSRVVSRFGAALAAGWRSAGVATCGKHFPGHGGVAVDSHLDRPECAASQQEMKQVHLAPFRFLIRRGLLDAVMPAHVVFSQAAGEIASLSPYWLTQVLRREFGFSGLVISDCLEMGAVSRFIDPAEAAVQGVLAGADLVMVSRSAPIRAQVFSALVAATEQGRIPMTRVDEAVTRVLKLKHRRSLLRLAAPLKSDQAGMRARSRYRDEYRMAVASITLVRDRDRSLPLDPDRSLLLLEWKKVVATEALSRAEPRQVLAVPLSRWFHRFETVMLELVPDLEPAMERRLRAVDQVVVAVFSRSPQAEAIQAAAVNRVLDIRPDAIVVALGNPYDLRLFPGARTYLATYGYRRVQARAAAAVLAGEARPRGRLPVRIFPSEKQGGKR